MSTKNPKEIISIRQLFFLTLAQLGGAAILYMPGLIEAGKDVWISNFIASVIGYIVVFLHILPLSLKPRVTMTNIIIRYWGRGIGLLANLYYFLFLYVLAVLVLSDVFYFGKVTMPETPGYVFVVFFTYTCNLRSKTRGRNTS